ncbi:MAG TPA: phosphatase PAP2 family protein [Solirubrobacteraceae bacterium]
MRQAKQWTESKLLPRGWVDLFRQIAVFLVAFALYDLVRGLVSIGNPYKPFGDAMKIIDFERALHVFVEPSIQGWAENSHALMNVLAWSYLNTQLVITTATIVFIYVRFNRSYYFVRNMFLIAIGLALVGYWVFPTAPPRLMPEWGFTDTVSQLMTGDRGSLDYTLAGSVANMYAAVPSMHVCFAVMISWPMARLVSWRLVKVAWVLYPLLVTFVVVATANHFLVDVVLGALTAAIAAALAQRPLARARPELWAFRSAAQLAPVTA